MDDERRVVDWSGGYPYDDDPSLPYEPDPPEDPPSKPTKEDDEPPPPDAGAAHGGPPGRGTGLVCGRFVPPHAGHEYYVELARRCVEELTLVVFSNATDAIPGALRAAWLEEMFPHTTVIHAADVEVPARDARDFWRRWATIIRRYVPSGPTRFFTSDRRGARIAELLGAEHVLVDPKREAVPISATQIRERPFDHWRFVPACVRPYYAKRVALLGPEGSGKSTLARRLADRYETVFVPEYARIFVEAQRRRFRAHEVDAIARGQIASEDALARRANRLLFCDTDPRAVQLWSERMFDRCPAWVAETAGERRYALTLVNAPSPSRAASAMQTAFYARSASMARATSDRVVELEGPWDARWKRATAAIDELLAGWR